MVADPGWQQHGENADRIGARVLRDAHEEVTELPSHPRIRYRLVRAGSQRCGVATEPGAGGAVQIAADMMEAEQRLRHGRNDVGAVHETVGAFPECELVGRDKIVPADART